MVYDRNGVPEDAIVIRDAPEAVVRVVPETDGRVAIEHASGERVHQGLRINPENVDDLIAALEAFEDTGEAKPGDGRE